MLSWIQFLCYWLFGSGWPGNKWAAPITILSLKNKEAKNKESQKSHYLQSQLIECKLHYTEGHIKLYLDLIIWFSHVVPIMIYFLFFMNFSHILIIVCICMLMCSCMCLCICICVCFVVCVCVYVSVCQCIFVSVSTYELTHVM